MTNLTNPTEIDLAKWRVQATRAAQHVKRGKVLPKAGEDEVKLGFAFDDPGVADGVRVIKLALRLPHIAALSEAELADYIYETVLVLAGART